MRARWVAILALAALAPICAEFLVAYLDITGDLLASLFAVVFFMPLYGGAALLVREVSVRTGRGWRGRLLLAAAFGTAMTGLIDLSLWMPEHPEIDFWEDLQATTYIPFLGFSGYALLTWVLGHVVMSVAAPLAVVEAASPRLRDRRWLGPVGITLWSLGFLTIATMIHVGERDDYDVHVAWFEYAGAAAGVVLLVALAFSPWGRPVPEWPGRRVPQLVWIGLLGGAAMTWMDFTPFSWLGIGLLVLVAVGVAWLLLRWAASPDWGWAQVAALAWGTLFIHTAVGFASPVPVGVSVTAKVLHSVVLLALILGIGWILRRRVGRPGPDQEMVG
ncbi:MAG: hypothetical protein L0H93_16175 [Nocardioides sp.]|nr:hypothetical protein [Nocardioides sp.]